MFSRGKRSAFTLLEVILAVALVAMVTLTIYRFLEGNLRAIRVFTEMGERDRTLEALVEVLKDHLMSLPPKGKSSLLGEPHKFGTYSSDEMQWVCGPGNALFASQALGDYRVLLMMGKPDGSGASELGLSRVPVDSNERIKNWIPLLPDVQELRIRYFDDRLNSWLDKWSDSAARPALVRLEILRRGDGASYVRVLHVARQIE